MMVLGVLALAAPVAAGRWSLAILGIPLMVASGRGIRDFRFAAAC